MSKQNICETCVHAKHISKEFYEQPNSLKINIEGKCKIECKCPYSQFYLSNVPHNNVCDEYSDKIFF